MKGLSNIGLLHGCSQVVLWYGADDSPCIRLRANKMKSHRIMVECETLRRHSYA